MKLPAGFLTARVGVKYRRVRELRNDLEDLVPISTMVIHVAVAPVKDRLGKHGFPDAEAGNTILKALAGGLNLLPEQLKRQISARIIPC